MNFPTYRRSVLWTDATPPPLPVFHILSPEISTSSLLSPSPPHLSISSLGWKSDLIQARGGGEGGGGGFQVPLLNGSLCQDPWAINMTMWQCGRAFLKRDPVFVKCFPPLKSHHGAGQETWKYQWKTGANFDHTMWKGPTSWLTWARGDPGSLSV